MTLTAPFPYFGGKRRADTCHAGRGPTFASWTPRPVLNVTDISKPKGKKGSAWADREESTWIDKL